MVKHLLVTFDGNEPADPVLPFVRRFDRLGVSGITLLRTEMPVAMDEYAAVSDAALEHARSSLTALRRRLWDVRAPMDLRAEIGPAVATTLDVARESGSTLILAPAGRRPRLVRFLFGNATERLVQRSRIPVLVAPEAHSEDQPVRTILVPLDGGRASRGILPAALEMAQLTGAHLLLLCVLSPVGGSATDFVEQPATPLEEFECAEEQLYGAGAECAAMGVDFSVLVEYGDPVERILAVCRDRSVDWIAMATRGRSSLSRWLTPSATLRVLRQAALPLLTIRSEPAARPVGLGAPLVLGRH